MVFRLFITFFWGFKVILFLAFFCGLFAQVPYTQHINYPLQIPTKTIYDMTIDRNGVLYLGTDKGLFKFNGKKATLLPFEDTKQTDITYLKEDKQGRIWGMNFAKQVFYLYGDTLRNLPLEINAKYGALTNFGFTENQIWLLTHYALISYDFHTFKKKKVVYTDSLSLSQLDIFQNQVFVASNYKIMVFDEQYRQSTHHTQMGFEVSFQAQGNEYYCIQRREINPPLKRSVLQWKNNVFVEMPDIKLPKEIFVYHQTSTKKSEFWLCTRQGGYMFDPQTGNTKLIFPNKNVTDVIQDYQGSYWISTLNDGLWFCPSLYNQEILLPEHLGLNISLSSIFLFKNELFFGTNSGNIFYTPFSDLTHWTHFGKVSHSEVKKIIFDEQMQMFATGMGVLDRNKTKKTHDILVKDAVFTQYKGAKVVFIATAYGVRLVYFDKDKTPPPKWQNVIEPKNNHANNQYAKIYANKFQQRSYSVTASHHQQKLWVGYDDGLVEYDFEGNHSYIFTPNQKSIIAQTLQIDAKGRLWVGSFQQGVFVIENQKIIAHFAKNQKKSNPKTKLKSNFIQKIIPKKDKIWIGTDAEIGYFDIQTFEFTDVLAQRGLSGDFVYQDFMVNGEDVWVIRPKSIIYIPQYITKKQEELKMLPIQIQESNNFKIEVLHYKNPSKVEIVYRLKGTDDSWLVIADNQTTLQYNHLTKGNYTLEVYAQDIITQLKSQTQVIDFVIEPRWWETWWFWILCLAVVLLGIGLGVFLVIKRNQAKNILKEQLWISQIKALQNQMNPHFLYNILNTVQGLVYNNQKNEASELLGSFSDLMRNTLQISEQPYISLEKEIALLQLYVDLEKVRFEQDLECIFEINVTDQSMEELVPSMLVQPFVENAFKHGLLHKIGQKSLYIAFDIINTPTPQLRVTIEDNGIGRHHAQEIQARKSKKSTGFALNVTKKRIELLNKISKYNIKIDIIDKYNPQQQAQGTKVLINLYLPQ